MKNKCSIFLIFIFFVKISCFSQEIHDVEYYNLELRTLSDREQDINYYMYNKRIKKKDIEFLMTYFEELYLYYSEVNRMMDELTIYKKQLLKKMYIPDGIDAKVYWNKKEKKIDYYLSYKIIVYVDLEKMIKGDDLNE